MSTRAIDALASYPRRKSGSTYQISGEDRHLLGGTISGRSHDSWLKFDLDWSQVARITSATMYWTGDSAHGVVAAARTADLRLVTGTVDPYAAGLSTGEANWDTEARRPTYATTSHKRTPTPLDQVEGSADVTYFFDQWAPKTVKQSDGSKGAAKSNKGLRISFSGTTSIASSHASSPGQRPRVVLQYEEIAGDGTTVVTAPDGVIAQVDGQNFEGSYVAGSLNVEPTRLVIQLFDEVITGGSVPIWSYDSPPDAAFALTGDFAVPLPEGLMTSGNTYYWRARVTGANGKTTPWSVETSFDLLSDAPVLTDLRPVPATSLSTLTGVLFSAAYAGTQPASTFRIQLRAAGAVTWAAADLLWDTGDLTVMADAVRVGRNYGGSALGVGDYEWRISAANILGASSAWNSGGTFTLTQAWKPAPGDEDFLTGYTRRRTKARILIKALDIGTVESAGNRAPLDPPIAIIENASNIGASKYHNAPGEFHFTLALTDVQAPVIEPYLVSYHLELYRDEGWKEITSGLIVDFDANGDEIVFYGGDWLSVLNRLADERFSLNGPRTPIAKGGAFYSKDKISYIIQDQLQRAKDAYASPVSFMAVPAVEDWITSISISASFRYRLPFIVGLIDSHRAGTGRRTRLSWRKLIDKSYTWAVEDEPGRDRPNIRLEYGGLAQAFDIIPFGDFATRVLGLGSKVDGTLPMYSIGTPPDSSDTGLPFPEWRYGAFPKLNIWNDLEDVHDLSRRTSRLARQSAKLGKQLGIGLRVGALGVEDGWDICDSILVDIVRGPINTNNFGSGYWTIEGWVWRLFPDGHDDLLLSLFPRDDDIAPNADILTDGTTDHDADPTTHPNPTLSVFTEHSATAVVKTMSDWTAYHQSGGRVLDTSTDYALSIQTGGSGGGELSLHGLVSTPFRPNPYITGVISIPARPASGNDYAYDSAMAVSWPTTLNSDKNGYRYQVDQGFALHLAYYPTGWKQIDCVTPYTPWTDNQGVDLGYAGNRMYIQLPGDTYLDEEWDIDDICEPGTDVSFFVNVATEDGGINTLALQGSLGLRVYTWVKTGDGLVTMYSVGSDASGGLVEELYGGSCEPGSAQTAIFPFNFTWGLSALHRPTAAPDYVIMANEEGTEFTTPLPGQWIVGETVGFGDSLTTQWVTKYNYHTGSMAMRVDGVVQDPVEVDNDTDDGHGLVGATYAPYGDVMVPLGREAIQVTYIAGD